MSPHQLPHIHYSNDLLNSLPLAQVKPSGYQPIQSNPNIPFKEDLDPLRKNFSRFQTYLLTTKQFGFNYFLYFPEFKKYLNRLESHYNEVTLYYLANGLNLSLLSLSSSDCLTFNIPPYKPLHFLSSHLQRLFTILNGQIVTSNTTSFFLPNTKTPVINSLYLSFVLFIIFTTFSTHLLPTLNFYYYVDGKLLKTSSFDYNTNYAHKSLIAHAPSRYYNFPIWSLGPGLHSPISQLTPFAIFEANHLNNSLMKYQSSPYLQAQLIIEILH